MPRSAASSRPWLDITLRSVLAIIGGYALTYACTAALARTLPMPRADAVITATLLSFVIYLALVLWSFSGIALQKLSAILATSTLALALIGFWPQLLERLG